MTFGRILSACWVYLRPMMLALRELFFGALFSALLVAIFRALHITLARINAWQAEPGAPPDVLYTFFILITDGMSYLGATIIIGLYTYKGVLGYAEEIGFRKAKAATTGQILPANPVPLPKGKGGKRGKKWRA